MSKKYCFAEDEYKFSETFLKLDEYTESSNVTQFIYFWLLETKQQIIQIIYLLRSEVKKKMFLFQKANADW